MADVFISYKREEIARAAQVARALTEEGYSSFFDLHEEDGIHAGEEWDKRLEAELMAARCCVVLWSVASVGSNNVRSEARRAHKRRILVPAKIENCEEPIGLDSVQAADLRFWRGERSDPQWRYLVDRGIARKVGSPTQSPTPERPANSSSTLVSNTTPPSRRPITPQHRNDVGGGLAIVVVMWCVSLVSLAAAVGVAFGSLIMNPPLHLPLVASCLGAVFSFVANPYTSRRVGLWLRWRVVWFWLTATTVAAAAICCFAIDQRDRWNEEYKRHCESIVIPRLGQTLPGHEEYQDFCAKRRPPR